MVAFTPAIVIGAGLGAYTQDPLDHPIAAAVGAGIGGYAANAMSYHSYIKPVAQVSKNIQVTEKSEVNFGEKILSRLTDIESRLNGYYEGTRSPDKKYASKQATSLSKYEDYLRTVSQNVDTVMSNQFGLQALNGQELRSPAGLTSLKSFVNAQETNSPALKMLYATMSFDSNITIADMKVSSHLQPTKSFKISAATSAVEAENLIREHLINQLGHGGELNHTAALKAKVLSEKLAGFEYSVDDALHVTANGRTESIPLTAYDKDGVRFSKVGSTRHGVLPMNPFAGHYMDKKEVTGAGEALLGGSRIPTAKDVLRQYDPELLLGFTDLKNGSPARALAAIGAKIKSHSEYLSTEAHGENLSPGKRQRLNNQVYAGYKISEDGKIRDISMVATDKNGQPELRKLSGMLTSDAGENVFSGVNANSLRTFNANPGSMYYAGLFPTMERGAETILDRGYASAGDGSNELARLLGTKLDGKEFAGLSNAVVFNRMDVDDDLSRLASNLFGSHISLDDGAGLFNASKSSKFGVTQNITMDIASLPGSNKFMLNDDFKHLQGLAGTGKELEEAQNYFKNFKVKGNDVLGFDGLGQPVRLGKEYTHAQVVEAFVDEGKLKVSMIAKYEPKDWVKIFSNATKSGLTKVDNNQFDLITGIENLRRQKMLDINGTNITWRTGENAGSTWDIKRIKLEMAVKNNIFERNKIADVDILSRAKDTGAGILADARNNNIEELTKYAERFNSKGGVPSTSPTINKAVSDLLSKSTHDRMSAAQFLLSVSDNKANSDMFLTALDSASKNKDDAGFLRLNEMAKNRGKSIMSEDATTREASLRSVYENIRKNLNTTSNIIKTTATMDLGESIRGAGNYGRISWLEQLNLKNNGWTTDDLAKLGKHNSDALYELAMVESRVERGTNFTKQKLESGERISAIFGKTGKVRAEELKLLGMNENGRGFVSYALQTEYDGVRSIGIPTRDTNLSGVLDIDGKKLIKQIDQSRQALIMADVRLAKEASVSKTSDSYKRAFEDFKSSVSSYNMNVNRMFKGDNNLMKNALRLESDNAVIHNLRSADGQLAAFTESQMIKENKMQSIIGFSQEGFDSYAKKVGLDNISYEAVKGHDNLFKVKQNNKDYLSMITREPAQGPLSSYAAEVYVDRSIKGSQNHVFIPKTSVGNMKSISAMYQFADFDADAGRITSMHKLSDASKKRIMSIQNTMVETGSKIAELQKAMGSKGVELDIKTLADFNQPMDFNKYLSAAGQKGKMRKMLAPFATDVATNMNAALEKHLSSLNLGQDELIKRSMTGRSVIHNLVENLLKTQHKKTDPGTMEAITEMENLLHAHTELLNDGDRGAYKNKANQVFDALLGKQVNKPTVSAEARASYASAVDDITESVSRYAKVIDFEGWEQKHGRFGSSASVEKLNAYIKSVSSKGMLPHEISDSLETNIDTFTKNAKGYIEYAKNLVSDNKKTIGVAALGLAATAAFMGAEPPDLSKETLPTSNKNGILAPIPTEKGYVTKGRDYRSPKTYNVRASNNQGDPRQKVRELFKDKSRSDVIIKDKRDR